MSSKLISENLIKYSFKKVGINPKFDGTEEHIFEWPKKINYEIVENIPDFLNNTENKMKIDENSEEDILFEYERHSMNSIRKEAFYIFNKKKDEKDDKITKDYDDEKLYICLTNIV